MENQIEQVSDTAAWIAMYRAMESARPDAVFRDELAGLLAGDKGRQIVKNTPYSNAIAFAMVVRTTAIDRLIRHALASGVDTVINLGAGLDTRPYRMELPADLRWIEVDFQHMVAYKNNTLKGYKPNCRLDRIATDLSNNSERKELFTKLGTTTSKALVITEGVIAYLANEQATDLSKDIYAVDAFKFWIIDYSRGKFRKNKQEAAIGKTLTHAPWKFDVEEPVELFKSHGWKEKKNIYMLDEADRIGRKVPLTFPNNLLLKLFPKKIRKVGNETYGFILFYKP